MRALWAVFKRELAGYFATPLAYVFIVIFLAMAGVATFELGQFYERAQADLQPFFDFHPWLYLFLIPAVAMRLWAEDRRVGTIELIMTLPLPQWTIVTGKFLAAWAFAGVALTLTFPLWITVNVLGEPDNGVIFAGYVGSFFLAGGFLAIGACVSATTKSRVVAFVVTLVLCLVFLLAGFPPVLDFVRGWAPMIITDGVAGMSFLTHFDAISRGVIDIRDVVFFGSLIGAALVANAIIIELKKAA